MTFVAVRSMKKKIKKTNVNYFLPCTNNNNNYKKHMVVRVTKKNIPRLIDYTGDKRAFAFFPGEQGIANQRENAASNLATIPCGHDLQHNYL